VPRRSRASGPRAAPGAATDPEALARQISLKLLTTAPRTRAQLAQALQRRGVPAHAAEAVLARFTDAGLIDDAAFARAWVESRHHSRGLSRRSLSAELRQRGVGSDDISEAVQALDPEQEAATARRLVGQAMARTRGQPWTTSARSPRSASTRTQTRTRTRMRTRMRTWMPGSAAVWTTTPGPAPAYSRAVRRRHPGIPAPFAARPRRPALPPCGAARRARSTTTSRGQPPVRREPGGPAPRARSAPFVRNRAVRGGQRCFA
jgi:SOS response regulatory protein OraA/RecX